MPERKETLWAESKSYRRSHRTRTNKSTVGKSERFLILNFDRNSSGCFFSQKGADFLQLKSVLQNSKSMHSLSNFAFQSSVWVENRRNALYTKREVWKYMQLMLYDAPYFLHTMPRSLWLNKRPISLRLWCKVGIMPSPWAPNFSELSIYGLDDISYFLFIQFLEVNVSIFIIKPMQTRSI